MTKIAVISDSHDNIPVLKQTLAAVRQSGASILLHCGDLCAPFNIDILAEGFSGEIHIIFGNNDGDGRLLQTMAAKYERVHLHGIYHEFQIGERRIGMIHYPEPALRIAQSGELDLVCYGHDHTRHIEQIGSTWLINPGEILGLRGAPGWALYDCESHTAELIEVTNAE